MQDGHWPLPRIHPPLTPFPALPSPNPGRSQWDTKRPCAHCVEMTSFSMKYIMHVEKHKNNVKRAMFLLAVFSSDLFLGETV